MQVTLVMAFHQEKEFTLTAPWHPWNSHTCKFKWEVSKKKK